MKILNDFVLTYTDIKGECSLLIHVDSGCNLHCYECYNYEELIENKDKLNWATKERLFNFLDRNIHMYDYILISGGEPTLLGRSLIKLCIELKDRYQTLIALNTNGTNPDVIKELIELEVLDRIYMDLKIPIYNYNFKKYNNLSYKILGVPLTEKLFKKMERTLHILYQSKTYFELRTVKYPFLKPNMLKKYRDTVKRFNALYGKKITYEFNDFIHINKR